VPLLYADNAKHGKIREMSSRKNEQAFNKIAIDLVNGKSRYVSLDSMVGVLKSYQVVEFSSEDVKSAQDIIMKEVAFRMLKQHYLPRVGDKIRVYKLENEFSADTGVPNTYAGSHNTAIRLPLELATIQDEDKLQTIYWADLVMQISAVIERLWLKRISQLNPDRTDGRSENSLLDAAFYLRVKFLQQKESQDSLMIEDRAAHAIVRAAEERIEEWLNDGVVSQESLPAVAEMIIQYIILSGSVSPSEIASELKRLESVDSLKEALLGRINRVADSIKNYNPADYAVFAMLQSLVNEVSSYPGLTPVSVKDRPLNIIDSKKSRHSA